MDCCISCEIWAISGEPMTSQTTKKVIGWEEVLRNTSNNLNSFQIDMIEGNLFENTIIIFLKQKKEIYPDWFSPQTILTRRLD